MLIDGMGGISAGGIHLILELEEIPNPALFTKKLLIYLSTALNTQREG